MPISQLIADFKGALDAARAEFAQVEERISILDVERRRIVETQPHTEDIAAVFLRGVAKAAADFESQLRAHLGATYVGRENASAADGKRAASILRVQAAATGPATQTDADRARADFNAAALVYFLRDKIAAEIPALVERLCPAAHKGMKLADRNRALGEIDAQLDELRTTREALISDITAARAASH